MEMLNNMSKNLKTDFKKRRIFSFHSQDCNPCNPTNRIKPKIRTSIYGREQKEGKKERKKGEGTKSHNGYIIHVPVFFIPRKTRSARKKWIKLKERVWHDQQRTRNTGGIGSIPGELWQNLQHG